MLRPRRRQLPGDRGRHPRPRRHQRHLRDRLQLHPHHRRPPASTPSPTPCATTTASPPPAPRRCGSTPVRVRPRSLPDVNTDHPTSTKELSVGFTTARLLANDSDPQNQTLTVVAVSEPSNDGAPPAPCPPGSPTPPATTPPRSTPTTKSTTSSPTPTATSPKATSPSASRHQRHQHTTHRSTGYGKHECGHAGAGDRAGQRLRPRRRQLPGDRGRHPRPRRHQRHLLLPASTTPPPPASPASTITYTLRDTLRPHLHRAGHGPRRHDGRPKRRLHRAANYQVQAGATLPITLSAVDPNGSAADLDARHSARRPARARRWWPLQLTYTAPTNRPTDAFVYEVATAHSPRRRRSPSPSCGRTSHRRPTTTWPQPRRRPVSIAVPSATPTPTATSYRQTEYTNGAHEHGGVLRLRVHVHARARVLRQRHVHVHDRRRIRRYRPGHGGGGVTRRRSLQPSPQRRRSLAPGRHRSTSPTSPTSACANSM